MSGAANTIRRMNAGLIDVQCRSLCLYIIPESGSFPCLVGTCVLFQSKCGLIWQHIYFIYKPDNGNKILTLF